MEGTSSRIAGNRPRPRYPHPATLLFSCWRILIVCVATFFIHHFFTTTVVSPFIFNIVKSNFVQKFISNGALKFLAENIPFIGNRFHANGQTYDDALMYIIGTSVIHGICYTIINGFFYACDKYKLLQHYRIPVEDRARPTKELIVSTFKEAAAMFVVSGPMTLLGLFLMPGKGWKGINSVDALNDWSSTPFYTQLGYFIGALVFNEFFFYVVHRSVHEVPGVYAKIHRQHHRFVGAISISAEYAGPIEGLFANFLPTSLFLAMCSTRGVPVSVWYTWLIVRLVETFEAHSGFVSLGTIPYQLGLLHNSCVHHYYHHTQNRGNYGGYWTDYLGGTMDAFLVDERRLKAPVEIEHEQQWKGE